VTPTSTPVFPPGRYGRRREPGGRRRYLALVLVIPVVLVGLWIAYTLYDKYGRPTFAPSSATVVQVTDSSATVRFTVHKNRDETGSCRVRIRDYNGAQVGYQDAPVGVGANLTITVTLATTGRGYAADVLGCTAG
jgi:Domain of unknown function (DUF4307)